MARWYQPSLSSEVEVNTEMIQRQITGFILVGGHSRRFGSDKALALHRGRPLVSWAVETLRDLGLTPVLVGPDPTPYRQWCASAITNEEPGLGPVEGVRACLAACPTAWALILGVDMPGVTPAVLQPLLTTCEAGNESIQVICYGRPGKRRHPFPGLYRTTLLAYLSAQVAGGPMQRLLDDVKVNTLAPDSLPVDLSWSQVLQNINTVTDLEG